MMSKMPFSRADPLSFTSWRGKGGRAAIGIAAS